MVKEVSVYKYIVVLGLFIISSALNFCEREISQEYLAAGEVYCEDKGGVFSISNKFDGLHLKYICRNGESTNSYEAIKLLKLKEAKGGQ